MAKKINGKAVAKDFQSGMSENSIMAKYGLSPSQLSRLKEKLLTAGLLQEQQTPQAPSLGYTPNIYDEMNECPSCGLKQADDFDECPRCGVIVSKMSRENEKKAEADKPKPVEFSDQLKSEAVMPKTKGPFMKIVFLLIICLAVAVYLVYFRGEQGPPKIDSQLNIKEDRDGIKRLDGKAAGKFRNMINKSAPNLEALDQDLGEAVNSELGELGDAADEKYERFMDESTSQGY